MFLREAKRTMLQAIDYAVRRLSNRTALRRPAVALTFEIDCIVLNGVRLSYEAMTQWWLQGDSLAIVINYDRIIVIPTDSLGTKMQLEHALARFMVSTGRWTYTEAQMLIGESSVQATPMPILAPPPPVLVWNKADGGGKLCAICLEIMEGTVAQLPCGHYFHQECAHTWFRAQEPGSISCCVCRSPLCVLYRSH